APAGRAARATSVADHPTRNGQRWDGPPAVKIAWQVRVSREDGAAALILPVRMIIASCWQTPAFTRGIGEIRGILHPRTNPPALKRVRSTAGTPPWNLSAPERRSTRPR